MPLNNYCYRIRRHLALNRFSRVDRVDISSEYYRKDNISIIFNYNYNRTHGDLWIIDTHYNRNHIMNSINNYDIKEIISFIDNSIKLINEYNKIKED